jgi:hypothetical protein
MKNRNQKFRKQCMWVLIGLLMLLAACQSTAASHSVSPQLADKEAASREQWTQHHEGTIWLDIAVPEGWETYNTAAGIVLNEHADSIPNQPLRGFLVHIFVPHMGDFELPALGTANMAWYVLNQVISKRDYIGDALVSEPVAFEWDHHQAAYYLLNNRDGTVTMLLALALPDQSNMVVAHVSVPRDQADRIRPLLPDLLSTLTVDNQRIDASALRALPDPLIFPGD